MNPDETLQASNYASGFMSNVYPRRRVPDLSGLVGMQPNAIYIMLPVEPKDSIDVGLSGGSHPNKDETTNRDGWAAFSGTSAAAPQLAGASALVKQACKRLGPADVRDILMKSARDVTRGTCHPNTGSNPATVGHDLATGAGLVDAHKAVLLAKIRCLRSVGPSPGRGRIARGPIPPEPIIRRSPEPMPRQPEIRPTPGPRPPISPVGPAGYGTQTGIAEASLELNAGSGGAGLTTEDAQALEQMVMDAEINMEDVG